MKSRSTGYSTTGFLSSYRTEPVLLHCLFVVCRIPFQSLLSFPSPLTLSLCLVLCLSNNPPRCRNRLFRQRFSNSLPHCRNQGIRQPSRPDKARTEFCTRPKKKGSPLAAVGATFTPFLADEAAAECGQAGPQASSVFLLSYDDLL